MGEYGSSPFKFNLIDLQSAKVTAEGIDTPSVAYDINLGIKKMVPQYVDFMKACGYYNTNTTNGISLGDYVEGYAVLAFNLTRDPSEMSGAAVSPPKTGSLSLHLNYRAALAQVTTFITYMVSFEKFSGNNLLLLFLSFLFLQVFANNIFIDCSTMTASTDFILNV